MRLRGFFLTGALGAALLLGGAATAEARGNCGDRIHREEHKLQRDIRRHGLFSRQAQHRRAKIHRLHQQCGESFFGWRDDRGRGRGRWNRDDDWRWRNDRHRDGWRWDGRRWRRR